MATLAAVRPPFAAANQAVLAGCCNERRRPPTHRSIDIGTGGVDASTGLLDGLCIQGIVALPLFFSGAMPRQFPPRAIESELRHFGDHLSPIGFRYHRSKQTLFARPATLRCAIQHSTPCRYSEHRTPRQKSRPSAPGSKSESPAAPTRPMSGPPTLIASTPTLLGR